MENRARKSIRVDPSRQIQRFYKEQEGIKEDSWRACIASIMEIPWFKMEHFVELEQHIPGYDWFERTAAYIQKERPGWTIVEVEHHFPVYSIKSTTTIPNLVIAVGSTSRGNEEHAVLLDSTTGRIVWDPHPSWRQEGLKEIRKTYAFTQIAED